MRLRRAITTARISFFLPPKPSNPFQTQVAAVNYANYPTGSSGHTVYVFGVTVPVDASKTVQAVVLPKVNGSVAGYQAALHIFAMGL